jgi:transglutaminase-like putative cysteine protease/predicted glutamine amidotransferase
MPNLLAMSFEGQLSPSFDLRCLQRGRTPPDGWGIGYYPGGEPSASVLKEPAPPPGSIRSELVRLWERVASSVFVLHIRAARWGSISDANTQPFSRSLGGRDWLFVHSGSLEQRIERSERGFFEPVGSTDTEAIFCEIMTHIAARKGRGLHDIEPPMLHAWFGALNELGVLTCAITDGSSLAVYADQRGIQPAFLWQLLPPYEKVVFGDDDLQVDLTRRGAKARKGVVVSTSVVDPEDSSSAEWRELRPGSLVVLRQGAIVAEVVPETPLPRPPSPKDKDAPGPSLESAAHPARKATPARPRTAPPRRLEIRHRTVYRYEKPVERSTHVLRLEPIHDRMQRLASHILRVSVDSTWRDYDDVFGNRARQLVIDTPFQELVIDSHALVVTLDTDPLEFRPLHARTSIPLNWMPWQRLMLQPYLLPPELPDSQLVELHEYAMSFVERNSYDLIDSLLDMNLSLYKDYDYRKGSTTIHTTPFEVYVNRQGVCQDFTNLFICLARLLGIPARYVCGYLYTGPKHANRAMGEATHAWAQVYLPEAGWKGFDPTNGVLTQTDHVRVAFGRHYTDATPTSGTIFVGGGPESLTVEVTVEEDA